MPRFASMMVLLALTLTFGCGRDRASDTGGVTDTTPAMTPDPTTTMPDTAAGTGDFAFNDRQDFAQSIRQQLSEIDRQIADLADQAKSRGGAVSDRALANIRASRQAVNRNLQRIDTATETNWEEIKTGVNQAVDNLNEAIEAAMPK
jgi:hypothetical protein